MPAPKNVVVKDENAHPKLRIYLDNCCFNRPYDDQSQLRISLETQARQKFGDVGTELFISLVIREKFDYTRWRRQFFGDKSVNEINEEAAVYARNHPFKPQKPQVPIQREG